MKKIRTKLPDNVDTPGSACSFPRSLAQSQLNVTEDDLATTYFKHVVKAPDFGV